MKASFGALEIRPAVRTDATEILLVRREAVLAKAASHYDLAILSDWANAVDTARIARQISDPDYRVLVAEAGGKTLGFAMAILSKHELKALYTKPNPIGGIGRALLSEIENLAFQATPYLVCEASLNAERFYQANGYTGEVRKDRAVKIDADIWVIHAFQKKSKSGIKTPRMEVDLIHDRLKRLKETLK